MGIERIPVVGIGPGTQPAEGDGARMAYIEMPKEMARVTAPEIPEPEAVSHLHGAR
jgi:hydrogenase-1 operon protein HyaF